MAQYKSSGMDAAACLDDENGVAKSNDDAAHLYRLYYPDMHLYYPDDAQQTRTGDLNIISSDDVYDSSVEPAAATYYNSEAAAGEALPLASQVFGGDKKASVPGAFAERLRHGLPTIVLSVASLAVTWLATGETTPAAGLGLFVILIAGLSAVTIRAFRS